MQEINILLKWSCVMMSVFVFFNSQRNKRDVKRRTCVFVSDEFVCSMVAPTHEPSSR